MCGQTLVNGDNHFVFYTLLLTLPMLVFTNILYPYPDDTKNKMSHLINAYSMLDIIDMAELMFGDVGCYQTYEKGFIVFFYFALLASAVLTSFDFGLEQQSKETNISGDAIMTAINMIFNDGFFLTLRAITIHKNGHAYFGIIFILKEALSFLIRFGMLITWCRE